jgi:hypothetical protein
MSTWDVARAGRTQRLLMTDALSQAFCGEQHLRVGVALLQEAGLEMAKSTE